MSGQISKTNVMAYAKSPEFSKFVLPRVVLKFGPLFDNSYKPTSFFSNLKSKINAQPNANLNKISNEISQFDKLLESGDIKKVVKEVPNVYLSLAEYVTENVLENFSRSLNLYFDKISPHYPKVENMFDSVFDRAIYLSDGKVEEINDAKFIQAMDDIVTIKNIEKTLKDPKILEKMLKDNELNIFEKVDKKEKQFLSDYFLISSQVISPWVSKFIEDSNFRMSYLLRPEESVLKLHKKILIQLKGDKKFLSTKKISEDNIRDALSVICEKINKK